MALDLAQQSLQRGAAATAQRTSQGLSVTPRVPRLAPTLRTDGLWAEDVEWTPDAAAAIARGEYAYFSPVVFWDEAEPGTLRALGSVALTDDLAMKCVPALVAGRRLPLVAEENPEGPVVELPGQDTGPTDRPRRRAPTKEQVMEEIAKALGLGPEATVAEILDAIARLKSQAAGAADEAATVATVAKRLALDDVQDLEQLVTVLQARRAREDEQVTALRQQVTEMQTQVSGLRETSTRAEFEALLARREHAGKIAPAKTEWAYGIFKRDRKEFTELLELLPPQVAERSVFPADPAAAGPVERPAVIAAARKTFAAEVARGAKLLASEKAWVHTALRDAGQPALTPEEIAQYGIRLT